MPLHHDLFCQRERCSPGKNMGDGSTHIPPANYHWLRRDRSVGEIDKISFILCRFVKTKIKMILLVWFT